MELRGSRRRERDTLGRFIRDPGTGRIYKRGKLLGKGAFGRCYKLTDMSTDRVFALKVVPRTHTGHLEQRGKVEREIELHSCLRHRNVVGFHRHFADHDHIYMVLEYCSRKSLAHILKARKTLTEPEARYYLRGIVGGLRYLHQQGIIHRDLKLSNFFVNKNMEVKIGDLGLATRAEPGGRCRGVLCGTPNYLAPEVISRKGHSVQSDIWALGCIMYTVLTGSSPFKVSHLREMYQSIREARYPVPAHLSPHARHLVACLLAPNPANRPSLDQILAHDFFTQGFTPDRLPTRSCYAAPIFAVTQPLGKLFQKATQRFLGGAALPLPAQQAGPSAQELPANHCLRPAPQSSKSQNIETVHRYGDPSSGARLEPPTLDPPIRLLMRGTLGSPLDGREARPEGSPGLGVHTATRILQCCLNSGPPAEPILWGQRWRQQRWWQQRQQRPMLCVTKWVDYSNKYGFGYQLSDGGFAVLLRDGTHMALRPPLGCVCYSTGQGEPMTFSRTEVPRFLAGKLAVLQFFTRYMQQQLLEGGNPPTPPLADIAVPGVSLLHFLKSDQALLMLFSDGTLQVNFYRDRTKLVLSWMGEGPLLTYIDQERRATTYQPGTLQREGCASPLRQRLSYALRLLQKL
ncbi:inactive serine/threonine-protein kinase PLK5 isoform X1 [Tachyglossus aculeatus]|uniref:inactive serine/threonine-protein kinase PLK5 isoform X1 n=2 Tax=Tachyglossus aculeatus TaxID=9261 RepID=UPI0018F31280|nr:inactive serine/threonine-protein kinase PLK5 isoform X1 [Tachyglossus aculeatus]